MPAALQFAVFIQELIHRDQIDLDDEEEVDEEDGDIENPIIHRPLLPDQRFDINTYNDDELKLDFRFHRQALFRIVVALRMPDILRTRDGDVVTSLEALCILLYRLSFPVKLHRMKVIFNRTEGPLSRIINTTLHWITSRWGDILYWDQARLTPQKLEELALLAFQQGRLCRNIFGFIDGTCRKMCRPKIGQQPFYNGRKKFHCLNYQGIVSPDGIIIHLSQGFDGNTNDIDMFRRSNIAEVLNQNAFDTRGERLAIYGDSAYMIGPNVVTKFEERPQMLEHERHFNSVMNAQRIAIEWSFGKVVQQFSALDFSRTQRLLNSPIELQYKTAVLFTNIHTCFYGCETSDYFDAIPPPVEMYLSEAMFNDI
jgi:hypothetical protein